jgi:hypothetical protein
LLVRQEKMTDLRAEAARAATDFDGPPEDFLFLAQIKVAFGDWRDAHDLAYRTWLTNQGNPTVNVRYVGVFFRQHPAAGLDMTPATVALDMAVCLRSEDGNREVFIIEPDATLRSTPRHLPPDHRTAELLINQPLGARIVFPDTSSATIEWIKPKQLHVLNEILENFPKLFPEAKGLERLQVKPGEPGAFQPVFDRVRERHEAIEDVFRNYASGALPIALVARFLGMEPLEAFFGLIQSGRTIFVCEGTNQERAAAFAAIDANGKRGCVLDAITLNVVRSLNLDAAVRAVCGPIGIVDSTLMHTQARIQELEDRLGEPDRSLFWRQGQIYRAEVTPDQKREILEGLRKDKEWMESSLEILPAQGRRDPHPAVRDLIRDVGAGFVNELFAAQGADRLFVSEDKTLRALAESEFGLRSSWLQPILMKSVDSEYLSRDDYNRAVLNLIRSGFEFTSLDPWILVWSLHATKQVPLPDDFLQAVGRLGGPKADLQSHIGVAIGTIRVTWANSELSLTLRQAIVGTLLENLAKERPLDHLVVVLRVFFRLGTNFLRDQDFVDYLQAWLRGHFIILPGGSY